MTPKFTPETGLEFTSEELTAIQNNAYDVAYNAVNSLDESGEFEGEGEEFTLADGESYLLKVRGYAYVEQETNDYYDRDFGCIYTEYVGETICVEDIEVVLIDEYDRVYEAPVYPELLARDLSTPVKTRY